MSAHACLLAAADLSAEPEIVRLLQASGIHVRRRCLDAADLLAAAWVDPQVPVVLSAVLPRLTRECITRLQAQDRLVLGLAHDSAHELQLRDWGIAEVLLADEPAAVVSLLAGRLASAPAIQLDAQGPGVWSLGPPAAATPVAPAAQPPSRTPVDHEPRAMPHRRPGAITAVWGPDGAPGRSTTALAVGAALAAAGSRTLVIDADTTAPALALLTGVIEDASGILVAARYAAQGLLTPGALATIARPVTQECALLGGIAHGRRWRELRPESLIGVLDVAQQCFDAVIVDVAAGVCTEPTGVLTDERDAITTCVLQRADHVVGVGRGDDLGVARLLSALAGLQAIEVVPEVLALRPSVEGAALAAARRAVEQCSDALVVELPVIDAAQSLDAWVPARGWRRRLRRAAGVEQLLGAIDHARP